MGEQHSEKAGQRWGPSPYTSAETQAPSTQLGLSRKGFLFFLSLPLQHFSDWSSKHTRTFSQLCILH